MVFSIMMCPTKWVGVSVHRSVCGVLVDMGLKQDIPCPKGHFISDIVCISTLPPNFIVPLMLGWPQSRVCV